MAMLTSRSRRLPAGFSASTPDPNDTEDPEDPIALVVAQPHRVSPSPRQGEMILATTVNIHDRGMDTKAELQSSTAHLATLHSHIERLEREIKDCFNTRNMAIKPEMYFPSIDNSSHSAFERNLASTPLYAETGEELVSLARKELLGHQERTKADLEKKIHARADNERNRNTDIAAACKSFQESAVLAAAGPDCKYNFMCTAGTAVYVEQIDLTDLMVINSKGQIGQYVPFLYYTLNMKMATDSVAIEIWHQLTPAPLGKLHREEPQQHYVLQELIFIGNNFPRVVSVTKISPSANEQIHLIHNQQFYCDQTFSARQTPNDATAGVGQLDLSANSLSHSSFSASLKDSDGLSTRGNNIVDRKNSQRSTDISESDLANLTKNLESQVAAIDEEKVKLYNYYTFLIRWLKSQNSANIIGSIITRKQTYFIGCINGDGCMIDLEVTEDRSSGEVRYYVSVRHQELLSLIPVYHSAYFAAGHHIVVIVQSRNNSGKIDNDVIGYKVSDMQEEWRIQLKQLQESAKAAGHITSVDIAGNSYCIEADNIHMVLYVCIGSVIFQLSYDQLPMLSANTFSNQVEEQRHTLPPGHQELTLTVTAMLSTLQHNPAPDVPFKESTDNDENSNLTTSQMLSGSTGSIKDSTQTGFFAKEPCDVCALTAFTSPVTYHPYLLIGGSDSSLRCVSSHKDAFGDEVFYYSSDYAPEGIRNPVSVQVFILNGDIQLAIGLTADGSLSILSIDRRALLSESRLLIGRKSITGLQMARSRSTTQPGGGRSGDGPNDDGSTTTTVVATTTITYDRSHRLKVYVSDVDSRTIMLSAGNECSIVQLHGLTEWLEENPKTTASYDARI